MPVSTRPLLTLYVLWHPDFAEGKDIADAIFRHFRGSRHANSSGSTGLEVYFLSTPAPGTKAPRGIALDDAETTAIVVLAEDKLSADQNYLDYVHSLDHSTDIEGLRTRLFPVSLIDPSKLKLNIATQALRFDKWTGTSAEVRHRLTLELTHELCRILRNCLARLENPAISEDDLESYLKPVKIFISHSKHDVHGEKIALDIRDWLHRGHGLESFFDIHNLPGGLPFDKVLLHTVRVSAFLAVYSDSYSSREWCRKEIIQAKKHHVPFVVANCVSDQDERCFPYMGNVPIVRLDPHYPNRINVVVGRLLDEVLKDFLWRCNVELAKSMTLSHTFFLSRTPELISLAGLDSYSPSVNQVAVYPDPPMGAEELELFKKIAPNLDLLSYTMWLAGVAP